MKRLREKKFEEVLYKEIYELSKCSAQKIENLRRLIWCYNKYYADKESHYHTLNAYNIHIRYKFPGIWFPEIKKKATI